MTNETSTITVGVPRETFPGEARVALVPEALKPLGKSGIKVQVEKEAGLRAGLPDSAYAERGAVICDRRLLFETSDIIAQVRGLGSNVKEGAADLPLLRNGQTLIGMLDALSEPKSAQSLAQAGVTSFSLELLPRITRAQSMDVLSSMATVAGYKAVLIAASRLPRMFPMLMTAAGTVAPAHVLVIGVGVAGLQAIATARRLGAITSAYDIRPAVKDQVQSLGAKFVELDLDTGSSEAQGGYAKAMGEEFYKRQRELLAKVCAQQNVIITTAAVPGKRAPILVTREMVKAMSPGSLIVDLAAERGGNCELTKPGGEVVEYGVTILGPENLPATVPYHASQMYSKNMQTFLQHLVAGGKLQIDLEDEITRDTLVTQGGAVVNARVKEALAGAR
jgi:H+-translocating NAD(P) transhydrogenase subunit alpha